MNATEIQIIHITLTLTAMISLTIINSPQINTGKFYNIYVSGDNI